MTEIVLLDLDTYMALYVDGKKEDESDTYNFDFEYGFKTAMKYPGATLYQGWVDFDWFDEYCQANNTGNLPDNLADVTFSI